MREQYQDINAADKDHSVTEYPDLRKDTNLPLRRLEEAKLLGHFCSVVLNRLRDCESRTGQAAILVGMQNAKDIMEVEVTAQIIESTHFNCNGNLRNP